MRHTAPADAATSQPDRGRSAGLGPVRPLPWHRTAPPSRRTSPRPSRPPGRSPQRIRASSPTCRAACWRRSIAEYERIEEVLGRLMSYAQLLFSGDSTNADIGRFYQTVSERVTAISSHLLFFALELNRLDEAALEQKLADPALARWRPWLRDLRVFRPHQLSDELEKLLHEKEVTGRSAWSRLFDETVAGMRIPLDGEELTVSATLNKLSDRDRSVREAAGARHRRGVRREYPAVLAGHQHVGEGQGDHRHVAPLPAPRQLSQPLQHGGGRGRRRAGDGGARGLPAAGASLLPDEGEVARPAEAACTGTAMRRCRTTTTG